MSKTHSGDITACAKKVALWLCNRARAAGPPTTKGELSVRVEALGKRFSLEDQQSVSATAMVLFRQRDPIGWSRMMAQYMEIEV